MTVTVRRQTEEPELFDDLTQNHWIPQSPSNPNPRHKVRGLQDPIWLRKRWSHFRQKVRKRQRKSMIKLQLSVDRAIEPGQCPFAPMSRRWDVRRPLGFGDQDITLVPRNQKANRVGFAELSEVGLDDRPSFRDLLDRKVNQPKELVPAIERVFPGKILKERRHQPSFTPHQGFRYGQIIACHAVTQQKRSVETEAAPDAPAKGLSRTAPGPTLPAGARVVVAASAERTMKVQFGGLSGSKNLTHARHVQIVSIGRPRP